MLVVLRGWPGYQCPFCTRQFGDYLKNAAKFEATGAPVLFVYPGPADGLTANVEAFTAGTPLPTAFRILTLGAGASTASTEHRGRTLVITMTNDAV